MNVRNLLGEQAKKYDRKTAIVFKGEAVSFSQLSINVLQLANALKQLGVAKGDKVAIYLPNCPAYVYSYLASFCLGAVVVPLDYMLKGDELVSCLGHSESKILIARPKEDVSLADIKKASVTLQKILIVSEGAEALDEGMVRYADAVNQAGSDVPETEVHSDDPALIMYTSGTTGHPKGIRLNYKHLDGSPQAMEHFVDLTDKDVKLAPIPLSHIGGFIYIQNCLVFGITLVLMDRFNPIEFLKNIQQYKVTCFHIVPAMYIALLSMKNLEKFDLSSLRWVVVFGAPSSPEIMQRFKTYCPNAQLLNGWGMTETCPPNTVTPLGSTNIASVGKTAPNCKIRIVGDDGQELPAGAIGEIVISGWVVMDCYYKDPEATAAVKRDGWLYTGDLGKFDAEGYLYIVGRKKEMIKVGGQIVYAPEVEAAFYKHEGVAEVAVIGVPDKLRGEAVKAFIVPKEGIGLSADEFRYFAKEHLANFKVPQSVELRKSLPKNRTGKVDKEQLREEILA